MPPRKSKPALNRDIQFLSSGLPSAEGGGKKPALVQPLSSGKPEARSVSGIQASEVNARSIKHIKRKYPQDIKWVCIWSGVMLFVLMWNLIFLNTPAFKQILAGWLNTFIVSIQVIAFTLVFAWLTTQALFYLESRKKRVFYLILTFGINLTRSIPQILGVLFGTIWITSFIRSGGLTSPFLIFVLISLFMSVFIFAEVVDLMRERINHYQTRDFFSAMRVCGISEFRIINFHILWKNSRVHIINKLITIFGMAIFLQCSVDFIISVGLSTHTDLVTLPATLGSLLAKIDSKQDILSIGYTITNPGYFFNLIFKHLQGITVSFIIVFSLLSIYHISNGYAERHRL